MSDTEKIAAAKKSDWQTSEMPVQHTTFTIKRKISKTEMEKLKLGNIPQEMEDKWFWYFENGKLYAHRSWTGFCIYILSFTPGSDTIEVTVNRDPEQYKCTDDAEDVKSLNKLLDWWTKPTYDYYHEWLAETLDNINKAKFAIKHETLNVAGKTFGAVYFHKPDEPHGFLSNWYLSDFVLDGAKYSSVEQYIMYRKCMTFGDTASAQKVMATNDPEQQQALARKAAGYNDVVWSGLRQVVLMRALVAKFAQDDALGQALLNTGDDYLVECAYHDKLWACGVTLNDDARMDIEKWSGRNILGFALMEVRMMLRSQEPAQKEKKESVIYINQDDITTLDCECIVNAANKSLLGGGGVDGAIHRAAGPELLKECRTLGGCETGEAKITQGYNLPAEWVIHTVGPVYSGKAKDAALLASCYRNSLELAKKHNIHSIAFPAISTGVYGYPLKDATAVAMSTVKKWLDDNRDYFMEVIFCCFNKQAYDIYQSYAAENKI